MSDFIKINLADRAQRGMVVHRYDIFSLEQGDTKDSALITVNNNDLGNGSYSFTRKITDEEFERLAEILTTEKEED